MSVIINILFVFTALLLIGVVLVQQPKTAGGLFSGTGQSLLGTSGKTFWTKFTTILAAIFMALCLLMSVVLPKVDKSGSSVADTIEKQQKAAAAQQQTSAPGVNPQTKPAPVQAAPNPQEKPAPQSAPGASKKP